MCSDNSFFSIIKFKKYLNEFILFSFLSIYKREKDVIITKYLRKDLDKLLITRSHTENNQIIHFDAS